jgi:rSAM/selenodomain-associated transferase 1
MNDRLMREVVVFAKAPVIGTVKTRLARDIGAAGALAVYREMLSGVVARLSRREWRLVLAVTPDAARDQPGLWPGDVARIPQGDGDLGARMLRVLRRAAEDAPVLVVGSDIPGLGPEHIRRAFAALESAPLVFGPASDGGFYLVGARGRPPEGLFEGVRWSTPDVLRETLATCPGGAAALIEALSDLDDIAGLEAARRAGQISGARPGDDR